jgi:hypothetical protein
LPVRLTFVDQQQRSAAPPARARYKRASRAMSGKWRDLEGEVHRTLVCAVRGRVRGVNASAAAADGGRCAQVESGRTAVVQAALAQQRTCVWRARAFCCSSASCTVGTHALATLAGCSRDSALGLCGR